jgi:hypothetical protein
VTDIQPPVDRRRRGPFKNVRGAFAGPGGKLLVIAPAVLALAAGVAIGHVTGTKTTKIVASSNSRAHTAGTVAPATAPVPSPGTPTDDASPGTTAPTGGGSGSVPGFTVGPGGTGTVSLVDLTPVSGAFQSAGDTSPVLNGKPQLLAIVQDLDYYNQTGDAAYNLGRHYLRFTGLLGIDDNSASSKLTPAVEIDGDGLKLATFTPTLGHPIKISVNVSGVLRIDIKWSDPGASISSNVVATLVLGNGQLTTVPGYHPSPSASPTG